MDMVKSVLASYTDESVPKAPIVANQDPRTEKLAADLQLSLLNIWSRDKKSPAEVAKLLNAKSSDELVRVYVKKLNWVPKKVEGALILKLGPSLKYVEDFVAKNPGNSLSPIQILTTRYGDEPVERMIELSVLDPRTKESALRLSKTQVEEWLNSGSKVDDVFKLLRLDKVGKKFLADPLLQLVKRAVQIFNRKNPSKKTSTIEVMRKAYGDEALAAIFISATLSYNTEAAAKSWMNTLVDRWVEEKPFSSGSERKTLGPTARKHIITRSSGKPSGRSIQRRSS